MPNTDKEFLFSMFWSAYPKKVAKQKAIRAFCKIKADLPLVERIIADVENRKTTEQWKKDGMAYVPHPATYLNDRRWEDEITPIVEQTEVSSFCIDDIEARALEKYRRRE